MAADRIFSLALALLLTSVGCRSSETQESCWGEVDSWDDSFNLLTYDDLMSRLKTTIVFERTTPNRLEWAINDSVLTLGSLKAESLDVKYSENLHHWELLDPSEGDARGSLKIKLSVCGGFSSMVFVIDSTRESGRLSVPRL